MLDTLDPRVRLICEELKRANGGVLPKRKGGAPTKHHEQLLLLVQIRDLMGNGMSAEAAIREVAQKKYSPGYERLVQVWYDRSANWPRWTELSLAIREVGTEGADSMDGPAAGVSFSTEA